MLPGEMCVFQVLTRSHLLQCPRKVNNEGMQTQFKQINLNIHKVFWYPYWKLLPGSYCCCHKGELCVYVHVTEYTYTLSSKIWNNEWGVSCYYCSIWLQKFLGVCSVFLLNTDDLLHSSGYWIKFLCNASYFSVSYIQPQKGSTRFYKLYFVLVGLIFCM